MLTSEDRQHIENKYHFADKPFDPFRRWSYHGYEYDHSTGLSDEEMDGRLAKLAEELKGKPHPVIKASLFACVLDNTRIDVNEHDWFFGIWSWGRPIAKYTSDIWAGEVRKAFPEETRRLYESTAAGADYGWLDFDHTVPDWDSMFSLGFSGLLERARASRGRLEQEGKLTEKRAAFFEGIRIEYEAVIRLLERLACHAESRDFEKAPAIAASLRRLASGVPETAFDVMMMIYFYFMISESVENYQVRSLGFGLDSALYPYYVKDLASGRDTNDGFVEKLQCFLLQWSAIGNYWGQPFYLGGTCIDGSTKVNEVSYIILDAYRDLGIFNPKIQIKYGESTPRDFMIKALGMIIGGCTSVVFCSEDHIVSSLMSLGYTYEESIDSLISGCYEYKVKNKSIGVGGIYPNLLKPVSLVFDNGFDEISGRQIGPKTGDISSFESFADFYQAYRTQLRYLLESDIEAIDRTAVMVADVNPSLLYSCTIPDCAEKLTDALDGGIDNTIDIVGGGIGTAVDALMAVYELVYETKNVTLGELKAAIDADWEGYEALRSQALNCRHRYGCGDRTADSYASAIMTFIGADIIAGRRNSHGGKVILEAHSARAFIIHGEKTKATPDGRKKGDETSKNASPTPGSDRNGVTALIRSVTGIDTKLCNNGLCLDVMLHRSTVKGPEGAGVMYALLQSYRERGGASMHFNIFDADMLRDAQTHPEQYKTLQVRICGWNALWNTIPRSEQDAYILRCEKTAD
ncbi:MAG: hypothetical protein K6D94_05870 [Clostridiales bacterium]|nr:hypothetical protein [Clostridiales bacterium]